MQCTRIELLKWLLPSFTASCAIIKADGCKDYLSEISDQKDYLRHELKPGRSTLLLHDTVTTKTFSTYNYFARW